MPKDVPTIPMNEEEAKQYEDLNMAVIGYY